MLKNQRQNFYQYDVVKIIRISDNFRWNPDGCSKRAPKVGDVATIVELYLSQPGFELECISKDGYTEWVETFTEGEIDLELAIV